MARKSPSMTSSNLTSAVRRSLRCAVRAKNSSTYCNLPDLPLELLLEIRDVLQSNGRKPTKCARNGALKIIASVNRSLLEKVLPFYLLQQGLLWLPSNHDQKDLGTFNLGKDAFQALGMLRRSVFFRKLLDEISNAHAADHNTRYPKLVCHIHDHSTADLVLADAKALLRIDTLASFLRSLPSSQQVFECIDIFLPERAKVVLYFWREIMPMCHARSMHIWGHASPLEHGSTSTLSAFPSIRLPLLERLHISHLAFSQSHWMAALSSIHCPSLQAAAITTNAPIAAVTGFLSAHPHINSIRSVRRKSSSTAVDSASPPSITMPGLRTLHGCQDRVASLISAMDSKATINHIHLDAAYGSYRSWIEGVLRCIPNQEIRMLTIGYVRPPGGEKAPLNSEILPRRLRRYEQRQLGYMSITLSNMSKQDAHVVCKHWMDYLSVDEIWVILKTPGLPLSYTRGRAQLAQGRVDMQW
ncbi:hypothetical protein HWV62_4173 [Athelia sp. TMB]|nr:hypothetical protein HWV62_4173 [Athelia sp. TMB]